MIDLTPPPERDLDPERRRAISAVLASPEPRRRAAVPVLAAVAAVTLALALSGVFLPRGGGPTAPAAVYAAPIRAVAEANQRLLLDVPGWKVTSVNQFSVSQGQMTFGNVTTELEIIWAPRDVYQALLRDRAVDSLKNPSALREVGKDPAPDDVWSQPIQVVGRTGTLFRRGSSGFTAILPPSGTNFVEIRTSSGSEQDYRDLVAKLYSADVNSWLAALPESVVKPADLTRVIAEMVSDIPVPAGFDRRRLTTGTTERYHVGARVSGAVACAWIEQWTKAHQAGETARAREAVAALKSSHSWNILLEMKTQGDYPLVLWEYADLVANGKNPVGYKQALGCS
jgi:hypothetical protein